MTSFETVHSDFVDHAMSLWLSMHTVGAVYVGTARDCASIDHAFNAKHSRQRLFLKSGSVDVNGVFFGTATATLNNDVCLLPKSSDSVERSSVLHQYRFRLEVTPGDLLTFSKDPYDMVIHYVDGLPASPVTGVVTSGSEGLD